MKIIFLFLGLYLTQSVKANLNLPDNFLQASTEIYSGAEPHSEAHFKSLASKGIKTLISVDGQTSKIALAKKYNLSYVHIPIGYDTIDEKAQLSLLRTLKDKEAPYFIHCHHGLHRGPSSAAIMQLLLGKSKEEAQRIMILAGTGNEYQGLWKSIDKFQKPKAKRLPELYEISPTSPMVAAMVMIDNTFDKIKKHETSQQNILYLKEGFTESLRSITDENKEFIQMLQESEAMSKRLASTQNSQDTGKLILKLSKNCKSCHKKYRH